MAERIWHKAPGRMAVALLLVATVAVAGCSKKSERVYFNGNYYPSKARAADKADRKRFTVSVRRADQGRAGAREAGRYGGKQYCLQNFGTSEIAWTVGPDAPDAVLARQSGRLTFSGTCVLW